MRNSCQLKSREVSEELSRTKMSYEKYFLRACVERVRVREREKKREHARARERSRIVRSYVSLLQYAEYDAIAGVRMIVSSLR